MMDGEGRIEAVQRLKNNNASRPVSDAIWLRERTVFISRRNGLLWTRSDLPKNKVHDEVTNRFFFKLQGLHKKSLSIAWTK